MDACRHATRLNKPKVQQATIASSRLLSIVVTSSVSMIILDADKTELRWRWTHKPRHETALHIREQQATQQRAHNSGERRGRDCLQQFRSHEMEERHGNVFKHAPVCIPTKATRYGTIAK